MTLPQRLPALPLHPLPDDYPGVAGWRLRVEGLVEHPLSLDVAEVAALASAETTGDFACVKGWVVEGLHWEGAPLAAILAAAGPRPEARWLRVRAGAYTVALPLAEACNTGLLALRLNGAPLMPLHGAPLRLIAPGTTCHYSVKWVDRIDLLADDPGNTV